MGKWEIKGQKRKRKAQIGQENKVHVLQKRENHTHLHNNNKKNSTKNTQKQTRKRHN